MATRSSAITQTAGQSTGRKRWAAGQEAALILVIASVLAFGFWYPLVRGGGFNGGDTYNYFFPLKQAYAASLARGESPFWNARIGNGVPTVGEGQTGVFYPPYYLAYRLLDLNTAYNATFLFHYVLGFVFAYWLGRVLELGRRSAMLLATAFVYGWFPARSCLEWAAATAAWLPACVATTCLWLQTGQRRWVWAYVACQALQLLAGHFQLAFVTMLTVLLLILTWGWPQAGWARRFTFLLAMVAAVVVAAPQLLPTWELKQLSQRNQGAFAQLVGADGYIPPWYFVQLIGSVWFYPSASQLIAAHGDNSNVVEAHLAIGLPLVLLLVAATVSGRWQRTALPWGVLLLVGAMLATGWGSDYLRRLPGFGYFRYPGRYGLMAELALAVLAGKAAEALLPRRFFWGGVVFLLIWGMTLADLYGISRYVQFVGIVQPPPIALLPQSEVFARLQLTDRVLAPDCNTLALSGAACGPPYLGMTPAVYQQLWQVPNIFQGGGAADPATSANLVRLGITHLLTMKPLSSDWPAELLWSGYDPFLHLRWGRLPHEPLYLYRLSGSPGRVYLADSLGLPLPADLGGIAKLVSYQADRVLIETVVPQSLMEARLILTELNYPGWHVTIDGQPPSDEQWERTHPLRVLRLSSGRHQVEWSYRPRSVYAGLLASLAALLALVTWTVLRGQQPEDS